MAAVGATLWFSGAAGAALRGLLELSPAHAVVSPGATLAPTLRAEVLAGMKGRAFASSADVVSYALEVSRAKLHFGMDHSTSLRFGEAEREGNCIEYAHLFGEVVELVAKEAKIDMKVRVVRSRASMRWMTSSTGGDAGVARTARRARGECCASAGADTPRESEVMTAARKRERIARA